MQGLSMMSEEQLPLEQSFVVSDIDWKDDPYNVIAEDEKEFNRISEANAVFEDPPQVLCEQSWGLYFAQKSPALGNIDGTSRLRPRFSQSPDLLSSRLMPRTPPENISSLNQSYSAPPKLSLTMSQRIPPISNTSVNRSFLLFADECDDVNNVPQLSIRDLMSPEQNIKNRENVTGILNESAMRKENEDNLLQPFDDCDITLQGAIDSAIQRRRSSEPKIIINQNNPMSRNTSNIQNKTNNIQIMHMVHIKKFHTFIQFHIDSQQMISSTIDHRKQECNDLIGCYVSKLHNSNPNWITHHTAWLNINTNQCTFHLLMNHHAFNKETKWRQVFLNMSQSYQWIISDHNAIVFSQFVPQKQI